MVFNPLESLNKFVDAVGNQINLTFKAIDDFIDTIVTFFVSMGYWSTLLIFFILFFLIISIPLMLSKYYENIKTQYDSLMKKVSSSISKK